MKPIYCLLILLCPFLSMAQPRDLKALRVGERVPDIRFTHLLNTTYTSADVSSLTGKLVLIDFWATWCSACVREFPKLDSLQAQFSDRLQVFLVNNSDETRVIQSFFEKHRNPSGKKYALPVVINDSQAALLFPHNSIPHTAWIYQGKVIAITGAEEITAANIETVLQGHTVNLELKSDVMDFDPAKPLLMDGNGGDESALLHRSIFTRYLKGMGSRSGADLQADSTLARIYFINEPVLKLYVIATGLAANRLVLEVKDTDKLIHAPDDNRWKEANFYSYELTVPVTTSRKAVDRIMQQDLDRQFGFSSHIEKRLIPCYALVRTCKTGKSNIINKTGSYRLRSQPLSLLIAALNDQAPGKPLHPVVLDETGYDKPVDLELAVTDLQDIPAMQEALQPWGLNLLPCFREIPVLVLSEASEIISIYSPKN